MKKSVVFKCLFIFIFCFISVQIFIVPAYLDNQERQKKDELLVSFTQMQRLMKLTTALHVNLFVVDPDLLSAGDKWPARLREGLVRSVTLGHLHSSEAVRLDRYRAHFETLGFKYYTTSTFDPGSKTHLPAHHFLCGTRLTVHIVEWFNRTKDTVWHSEVRWRHPPPLNTCVLDDRHFYQHPGLYDNFHISKVDKYYVPNPAEKFLQDIPDSNLVECNLTRADQFFRKNPPDSAEQAKLFQRNARQIIARAKLYLDELGIPFWLSSGTCLGWFRQCSIITYSQDVDLAIFIRDFKPELIPTFERGGFFLKHVFGKVSDSYELSFQAGDIKLDLFFFYEEGNITWNGGTHHETGQKYKYLFPTFNLCWTVFLDLKVRVPCPPQPYIEANYGQNWLEPVTHWEWNKSPPNVRENGVWPKEEWDEVIQVF
ncbi:ribitol-5-phosphate transferase FKTN-like [Mya arenaria]|uniref:ribitol-5-phosphate transferase FKTN-like n=1 Tax=Mya arenaria TaxID=6604 RepID=UPI0022E7F9F3|nr:ribitol-5-phosphate transferase FKTN-like [Mya arenaria]